MTVPGISESLVLFEFPNGGSLSTEFTADALDDAHARRSAWLELPAHDAPALHKRILQAGVARVQHPQHHGHTVNPERSDQRERQAHRPGRKPIFDHTLHRRRNVIERCVGWLKEARGIATRYETLALSYLAVLKLGMIRKLLARLLAPLSHTP